MAGNVRLGATLDGSPAAGAGGLRVALGARLRMRDGVRAAAAVLAVLATISAAWWTQESPTVPLPELRAGYLIYAIAVPSAVGLLWWTRRPANGIGPLLVALGLSAWLLSWQGASDPLLVALGVAATGLITFETFYLCMAFPTGRLTTHIERLVALGAALALTAAWLPVVFVAESATALTLCLPGCPPTLVDVNSASPLALREFLVVVTNIAIGAAVLAMVVAAYVRGSVPRRRASLVVLASSVFFLVTWIAAYAAHLGSPPNRQLIEQLSLLQLVARMLLPLGFLAALVRAEYYAAGAIRRVAHGLGAGVSMLRLRSVLAGAVGDPDLRVGVWDGRLRRYVDSDGAYFAWPRPGSGRAVVPIVRDGQPMAAIVADEAVISEPSLREAAATATVLAIDEQRAEGELMALRAQAVAASDAERQRIVRDLHDSAQQQLVALRVRVALIAQQAERLDDSGITDHLAAELDRSIEELRSFSRRFLPPSTIAAGVAPALRSLTTSWPIEITVHDRGLHRYSAEIEAAVFSCCVDAIRNAMEHGGSDVRVTVRLFERNGCLRFVVRDNGRGFDPADIPAGSGLTTMHDRVVIAGGRLSVISAPGRGAMVAGTIPLKRDE